MSTRQRAISLAGRSAVIATVAALALTAVAPSSAFAGGRHRFGGGGAAAAAFAGIVGTGVAIAAAQNRAAYYDDYYGGPVYAPAPVVVAPYGGYGYYGGYDPAYGPNQWGADTPYVNGHPLASW
jgi:hypothetical protein